MMAAEVASVVDYVGETVTYKRVTVGSYSTTTLEASQSTTSYTIKASVREYRAREIAGLVQVGDKKVHIAATSLSFTPKPADIIAIQGHDYRVVSVLTRNPFDEACVHILQVRG